MSRPKKTANRLSPYVRYGKSPYHYKHKDCKHKDSQFQSVVGWAGKVCTICNIITFHKENDTAAPLHRIGRLTSAFTGRE
jgi:hypothetical protein